jgi:hypothetical protein
VGLRGRGRRATSVAPSLEEMKLAQVEATREEARNKAKLEETKINVKKAKAMKQLLAEEREIMMMNTQDMNEQQMDWWKEASAEIMKRRRLAREGASGGERRW